MLKNPKEINLGYGEPYRNFIYIDDLLDAWETVITHPDECAGEIFCIGPDNAIKIKDYVKLIANKIGWDGHVNWNTKPPRPGEIYLLNSTNHKITSRLGWFPKVELSEGLDRTIAVWKDVLENNIPHNQDRRFSKGK
jgi:nucleoside-diphosphate-sugar epimerase